MPEGGPSKAHSDLCTNVCVSPVALAGGYRLSGAVDGVQLLLLLDTGEAVTLLREDVWARITAKTTQELQPWSALKLISAGRTPLTIHGSAHVELELEGEKFIAEAVVVSPLTSEAILGVDFLQEQQAVIDLASKRLRLRSGRHNLPLMEPTLLRVAEHAEIPARAVETVELPPRSELMVTASIETPVEGCGSWRVGQTSACR